LLPGSVVTFLAAPGPEAALSEEARFKALLDARIKEEQERIRKELEAKIREEEKQRMQQWEASLNAREAADARPPSGGPPEDKDEDDLARERKHAEGPLLAPNLTFDATFVELRLAAEEANKRKNDRLLKESMLRQSVMKRPSQKPEEISDKVKGALIDRHKAYASPYLPFPS
jgi:hypothetical protein